MAGTSKRALVEQPVAQSAKIRIICQGQSALNAMSDRINQAMRQSDDLMKKFYITTPIYYANGQPHIGHSYTTIAADVHARYHRLRATPVLFATGTDEHGQKVAHSAQAQGMTPQEFVDNIVGSFKQMWQRLHISYDRFIRTTDPHHMAAVQHIFSQLRESGDIYLGEYEGWYCVPCETYLAEVELVDGCCPECGRPVEQVTEQAYFFRTSAYTDRLLEHIESHPDFIQPKSRRNEVLSFVKEGLRDACVSRNRMEWDIPVPGDESQSIYVWFDALINYLSQVGYPDKLDEFNRWWPPQIQIVGKDILTRFHATLWPAMLMALDLPLPDVLFAHGWWITDSGDKISKSKGNILDPYEVALELARISTATTAVAVDSLRYFLLRQITFGLDGSFSWRALLARFNADLANDLGNLLNRTLPLVERYLNGVIPEPGPGAGELSDEIDHARTKFEHELVHSDFSAALTAIWELLSSANKFLDTRGPWALHKDAKQVELEAVIYDVLDCIRVVAIMIEPFMPKVSDEIWQQLGLQSAQIEKRWEDCRALKLPSDITIAPGRPIFPRVDIKRAMDQLQAESEEQSEPTAANTISIDEFKQVELRVGTIVEAHRIPGADKLLRLMVDVGESDTRQIVAGIAQQFNPRELLDVQVIVVTNLEPATIHGVESHGMILAAGADEPEALVITDSKCPPGTIVR